MHDQTEMSATQTISWARRAARLQRSIETRGPMDHTIFPIPLRAGAVTVRIQGLPHDLTNAEANKISAVVMAYVQERSIEPYTHDPSSGL